MNRTERRWLRGSVALAILVASITTVTLVMIAGAISSTPFQVGTLTASANQTMWNSATTVFNAFSLNEILIPVILIAVVIIGLLIYFTCYSAMCAGMSE